MMTWTVLSAFRFPCRTGEKAVLASRWKIIWNCYLPNAAYAIPELPSQKTRRKPIFCFRDMPNHNPAFNPLNLTILGVKSTCKDRWRQVLAEADRIEHKHLLTLEAAISSNQTDEMQTKNLQLVLPQRLHDSYSETQRVWLMDISSFITLVCERQSR
ncbi:MAG: type II restriction endonuclease [Methylococcales bacterium]